MGQHKKYFLSVLATVFVLASAVLLVNYLIDPLWFYGGNKVADTNHIYNERYSKAVLLSKHDQAYDCLIIGSSTATLLDEKKIDGYTCFNFAVSGGNVREFEHYIRFARNHMKRLRLVVLGLDPFNLVDEELKDRIPDFVRFKSQEPNSIRAYLGIETFLFSLKSMANLFPGRSYLRFYRPNFTATLNSKSASYNPEKVLSDDFERRFGHDAFTAFSTRNLAFVSRLRDLLPDAKFIGYAPPIAANYVGYLHLGGVLEGFLRANYEASRFFDAYYDFTIPSAITVNPATTPDGEHFVPKVNDEILSVLLGKKSTFGLDLSEKDWSRYCAIYIRATENYIRDSKIRLNADKRTARR